MTKEEAIKILKRCEAEAYCSHYKRHFCCVGCGQREALDMAVKALKQTSEDEWIPVSEKLPEERTIVNVTFADGTVGTARFYWKGCPILFGCIMAGSGPTTGDIVAWRPLPNPCKGEEKK